MGENMDMDGSISKLIEIMETLDRMTDPNEGHQESSLRYKAVGIKSDNVYLDGQFATETARCLKEIRGIIDDIKHEHKSLEDKWQQTKKQRKSPKTPTPASSK